MLKLIFSKRATVTLNKISKFVDTKTTPGGGHRFVLKFIKKTEQFAQPNVKYANCNSFALAQLGYSCVTIDGWLIVFKVTLKSFKVHRIIRSSLIH